MYHTGKIEVKTIPEPSTYTVSEELSAPLQAMGDLAIKRLAPFFGGPKVYTNKPSYYAGNESSHHIPTGRITVSPKDMRYRGAETIAHEVGHFLHHQVNPVVNNGRTFGDFSVGELVAQYCAEILLADNEYDIREHREEFFRRLRKHNDRKVLRPRKMTPQEFIDGYEVHRSSYIAARHLFRNFGVKYLPVLARQKTDTVFKAVRDLGYDDSLVFPYHEEEYMEMKIRDGRTKIKKVLRIDWNESPIKVIDYSSGKPVEVQLS